MHRTSSSSSIQVSGSNFDFGADNLPDSIEGFTLTNDVKTITVEASKAIYWGNSAILNPNE